MPVPPTPDNPHGWGPDPEWIARLIDEYRYSEKVNLKAGDHVRLSKGPYYNKKDGTKRAMGYKGPAVIRYIEDHPRGIMLYCSEVTKGGTLYGSTVVRITGGDQPGVVDCIVSRPHKVVKCRSPHRIRSL